MKTSKPTVGAAASPARPSRTPSESSTGSTSTHASSHTVVSTAPTSASPSTKTSADLFAAGEAATTQAPGLERGPPTTVPPTTMRPGRGHDLRAHDDGQPPVPAGFGRGVKPADVVPAPPASAEQARVGDLAVGLIHYDRRLSVHDACELARYIVQHGKACVGAAGSAGVPVVLRKRSRKRPADAFALARSVEFHGSGTICVHAQHELERGGFKVAKRATLVRPDADFATFETEPGVNLSMKFDTPELRDKGVNIKALRAAADVEVKNLGRAAKYDRVVSAIATRKTLGPDGLSSKLTILEPLYERGDLTTVLEGSPTRGIPRTKLRPDERNQLGLDLLESIFDLHDDGYLHLDVKSENALVRVEGRKLRLGLIDLASMCPFGSKASGCTVDHVSPDLAVRMLEVLRRNEVNRARAESEPTYTFVKVMPERFPSDDIFATGIVLARILNTEPPPFFPARSMKNAQVLLQYANLTESVLVEKYNFGRAKPSTATALLEKMLAADPNKRCTIREAIETFCQLKGLALPPSVRRSDERKAAEQQRQLNPS